jgi:hypothetical protein
MIINRNMVPRPAQDDGFIDQINLGTADAEHLLAQATAVKRDLGRLKTSA